MSDKILIFDTTLRDGEQSPGAALNIEEKMEIAKHLAKLNVDIMEVGFPISSPGDFEAVRRIANEIEGPTICGLSRVIEKDIARCWEAIKHAKKPRIHTFVGTSEIHIRDMFRKSQDEVLRMAIEAVRYAKSLCDDVEFSPMDATRTDIGYLCDVVAATIDAGATTINIPDTVGYAVPEEFGNLIRELKAKVPQLSKATISVHCHDDLGMSVANSLSAVKNGAKQIECTINGIGERAGNTALEEVVMAIKTRSDYFKDFHTDINSKEIYPISRLVSRLMGFLVPPNKAIVGANAFAHSSGIHQDGVIKERTTFEIIDPKDVGVSESQIILSPRSGRNALRHRYSELGYKLSDEQLNKVYERFLEVADKKKGVFDEDLHAIIKDEIVSTQQVYQLESIQIISGNKLTPTATVSLIKEDGTVAQEAAPGDGPVDAAYKAIDKITGLKLELENYSLHAVTKGKDAIGEVTIRVRDNGNTIIGHGASTDVIESSAKAYINAINKVVHLNRTRDPKDSKKDG